MKPTLRYSISFHVDEAYASPEPGAIEITYGYSRDHRPDLKQFIMNLICVGDGDIPVLMEIASGNQSDKARFAQLFQGVQQIVNLTDERPHILRFFSPVCRRYYLLSDPAS